ncbi:MAG: ABC transporter permease [Acidimicrobiaceae bacterium]|nr:ABC transporter permease [Acidimicrobiaceae bacterium]MCY4176399.1 ABC transporter permease [Acidimicrobiaceae bacterium]MCY4280624.1 ABC transporter permease [Acidimicrobiaceae bacterium]MCY4294283.1 ABC transporter permease [Acidimicrobiaceae bacterium]
MSERVDDTGGDERTDPADRNPLAMLFQGDGWRLERRLDTRPVHEMYATLAALVLTALIISLLVILVGVSPLDAFTSLYEGALGSREAGLETLVQATPLILTGLAAAVAFRSGVWNIGGEGQFFAGAIGTWWVYELLPGLPAPLLIIAMFVGAAVAGALWASAASVLLVRYGTNEILTTVMLNFVVLYILSWLLSGPWQSPKTPYFQTERMDEKTFLPRFIDDSRLHWGLLVALAAAVAVHLLTRRTGLGFELRAIGVNKRAAAYKGISVGRTVITVMAISGALAGIAGAGELLGLHHRLQLDIAEGLGFTGIIIALVARLHPAGVVVVAIAFGGLINGATNMQVGTGIPFALVQVIEGVALVFVLLAAVACRYRLKRTVRHG